MAFAICAAAPIVVPELLIIPANVVVGALPVIIQFLIVLLVAPLETDALPNQTTALEVPVLVLVMVKSLRVEPLLLPSIIT